MITIEETSVQSDQPMTSCLSSTSEIRDNKPISACPFTNSDITTITQQEDKITFSNPYYSIEPTFASW